MKWLVAIGVAAAAIAILAVTAIKHPQHAPKPSREAAIRSGAASINAVFRDWISHNGRFTKPHPCGAVEGALARLELPTDGPNARALADFARFRTLVCQRSSP